MLGLHSNTLVSENVSSPMLQVPIPLELMTTHGRQRLLVANSSCWEGFRQMKLKTNVLVRPAHRISLLHP